MTRSPYRASLALFGHWGRGDLNDAGEGSEHAENGTS